MDAEALRGGFADPAPQSARAFRAILEAMARPGTVQRIEGAAPPAPLSGAAGAVLLTLADGTTPVHLAGGADQAALRDWITFHCGAPLAGPGQATFALGDWAALLPAARYRIGSNEYPDRSITLIVEVAGLAPATHRLRGPGIADSQAARLPGPEVAALNAGLFPLGIDLILTCGDALMAIPRTTRVEAL